MEQELKDNLSTRLEAIKKTLTPQYIDSLLWVIGIVVIVCMVAFGYFWKNMYLLKLVVVIGLLLASALLCAKFLWYPETRPVVEEDKKKKKKEGMFDSVTSMLPDSEQYEKNMNKAMKF